MDRIDRNAYLPLMVTIWPCAYAVDGGNLVVLLARFVIVSVVAVPLAGVKVRVTVLGSMPTAAFLITVVMSPMLTRQVFGDAQSFPCMAAYRVPSRTP